VGFIQQVREGHPQTPIVVVSPIFSDWREREALTVPEGAWKGGALGKNFPPLEKMRRELQHVVKLLRSRGDANLFYCTVWPGRLRFGKGALATDEPELFRGQEARPEPRRAFPGPRGFFFLAAEGLFGPPEGLFWTPGEFF